MVRSFILITLGIILAVKGILFLSFPWKMKDWMELFIEKSDNLFRVWGVVLLILGLLFGGVGYLGKLWSLI